MHPATQREIRLRPDSHDIRLKADAANPPRLFVGSGFSRITHGVRLALSRALRQFKWFVTLRRLQHEGFANAYHRRRLWKAVLQLPPVVTDPVSDGAVEVHLVCCQSDYLCALWSLKTFYRASQATYPLVVHMNGRMSALARRRLRRHLPHAKLIGAAEADATVNEWLSSHGCPRLLEARSRNPFLVKLIDVHVLSNASSIVLLDSDILFFARPDELLAAVEDTVRAVDYFQRDAGTTYNVTIDEARNVLGIPLVPAVNTGIAVLDRATVDLVRCEQLMGHASVSRSTGWIEQTLYALVASEKRRVRHLSSSYLVSLEPRENLATLVARHYAGPSRRHLTDEGLPFVLNQLGTSGRSLPLWPL